MINPSFKHMFSQGLLLVVMFFAAWGIFSQVHWMQVLHVQELSQKSEKKLAELILTSIESRGEELTDTAATGALDSIITGICKANHLDRKTITYLTKAGVDPRPFGDFLDRLARSDSGMASYLTWINTHPDSRARAAYIRERSKHFRLSHRKLISKQTWDRLKSAKP